MRTRYNKTIWEDNKTPVNAENLNNIENGIDNLYSNAISVSELIEGSGIKITDTSSGIKFSLNFHLVDHAPSSSSSDGNPGDYYVDQDYVYLCLTDIPGFKWIKLRLENF